MRDLKKYMFLFPLVSVILSIIAILTPVNGINYMGLLVMYIWMWGLFYMKMPSLTDPNLTTITTIQFTPSLSFLIFSLFCSIMIILSIILFIISTVGLRKERNTDSMMIISSVILIAISITYMIGIDIIYKPLTIIPGPSASLLYAFWALMSPGFGIIGPIIAGIVGIAGALIDKFYIRKLKPKVKTNDDKSYKERKIQPDVGKVCSNCGYHLAAD
ncbi:MAG: hypothetical protein P8Y70_09010 [Candidatus Lokiarchaeota archaeon]